jgi:ADP-heptose:LPS heptosyltransferase
MKPRLLVVELHHLGDAVLSLPFVRGASRTHDVHVLCRPAVREIFDLLSPRPAIHVWEPPWANDRPCPAWTALDAARTEGKVLRPLGFAAAVCVWADVRTELLMTETRAPRRVGFPVTPANYYAADIPWRRHLRIGGRLIETAWQMTPGHARLLTDELHCRANPQLHLARWTQAADALGVTVDESVPWFPAGAAPSPDVNDLRRGGRQILAVHAQARVPSKQWPHARWRELLARPTTAGRFAVLEILPPGAEGLGGTDSVAVSTPSVAHLAATLASADAVLCHDSLPAHLAAALGKPVVTIFGSGEPDWFAPWRNRDRVVQRRVCPLHPCIDRCGMDRYLCLESIPVDDVAAQLDNLPRKP